VLLLLLLLFLLQLLELLIKSVYDPRRHQPTAELRSEACKLLAVASCALLDGTIDKVGSRSSLVAVVTVAMK